MDQQQLNWLVGNLIGHVSTPELREIVYRIPGLDWQNLSMDDHQTAVVSLMEAVDNRLLYDELLRAIHNVRADILTGPGGRRIVAQAALTNIHWTARDREAMTYFWEMYAANGNNGINPRDEQKVISWMENNNLLGEGQYFTNAGALLFGPKGFLPADRFITDVNVSYGRERLVRFHGMCLMRLARDLLRELDALWRNRGEYAGIRDDDAKPFIYREYPEVAIQEALINFIIHRDYGALAEAHIDIYSDFVQFQNPGTSPHPPEVFLQSADPPPRLPYQSNTAIIRIFTLTGLNQRARSGLWRIRQALITNGNTTLSADAHMSIENNEVANQLTLRIYAAKPPDQRSTEHAQPPFTQNMLNELLTFLTERLSEDEMHLLVFRLGLNFKSIEGESFIQKALSLMNWARETGKEQEILKQLNAIGHKITLGDLK